MAAMVALEAAIEQTLDQLLPEVSGHAEVSAMCRDFHSMVKSQLYALHSRLQTLAESCPIPDRATEALPDVGSIGGHVYPVSTALQALYTLFNQAVIGYATLQPISHRFRESWVIADAGTAAHLARQHTQNYVRAIEKIGRVLHDVVLWELDGAGLACQCTCPSCNLGVCLCAVSSRTILHDAWSAAVPITADAGVYVHPPRQDSAAAHAGLCGGDLIVAADGHQAQPYAVLQTAIREHKPGETIQLKVRRRSGEIEEIAVVCV
jgi:hypothetical protein